MPPPRLPELVPRLLPYRLTFVNVNVPPLLIPAPLFPLAKCPLEKVILEIASVAPPLILKIRKSGVPSAVFRFTVRRFAPGPLIFISVARFGRALVRLIVYGPGAAKTVESKVMIFESGLAFAALIASRRLQCPG